MLFRERLADWISGGRYKQAVDAAWQNYRLAEKYGSALVEIVDRDTPKAAPAAKRAANIARKALGK